MYRLAHATETTSTVWARHTSNGVLSLIVNGQTFTGDTIDTAVSDGTGTVTATGLAAGNAYPFILSVAGVSIHTGTLRTMPAAGSSFSMLWAYCWHTKRPALPIAAAMERYNDISAFFMGGDNIYICGETGTTASDIYGESIKNVAAVMQPDPDDVAAGKDMIRAMYRSRFRDYSTRLALEAYPTYALISDHDVQTGDNWDAQHLLTQANSYTSWAATVAQAEALYGAAIDAFWEYYNGQPVNADANNDAGYADDKQFYFDFVIGDVHVFCLDANTHKNRATSVEYGSTQVTWLTSKLSASTAIWKLIATGEGFGEWSSDAPLVDTQAIIDHITSESITGCLMIAGDIHSPGVFQSGVLPCMRGGQVSQDNHTNIPDGYADGTLYKGLGYASSGVSSTVGRHGVTVLRVTPDRLDVDYLDKNGNVFWTGYMLPTDTTMRHERTRIG